MSAALFKLYIVRCADGSLYTGIATDVENRDPFGAFDGTPDLGQDDGELGMMHLALRRDHPYPSLLHQILCLAAAKVGIDDVEICNGDLESGAAEPKGPVDGYLGLAAAVVTGDNDH